MKKNENTLYSLALSITSAKNFSGEINCNSAEPSAYIYEQILKKGKPKTQDYISEKYSADPLTAAKQIFDSCMSKSIDVVDYWHDDYPWLLKEIHRPPIILYIKGKLNAVKTAGIVGTRKSDKRSGEIARRIAFELGAGGYTIVSGMAIGIDREAHLGALHGNFSTIGILANGIDVMYPAANRDVYSAIVSSGKSAVLSEYPPGIHPGRWTFVRRNRLISGISLGTVVVKAGEKSGALITARYAVEQNRDVFVCPGNSFDESYLGCHSLLKSGAIPVYSTKDIMLELKSADIKNNSFDMGDILHFNFETEHKDVTVVNQSPDSLSMKIFKLIETGERDIDSIIRELDCSVSEIHESLIELELSGQIIRDGNRVFAFK